MKKETKSETGKRPKQRKRKKERGKETKTKLSLTQIPPFTRGKKAEKVIK